MSFLIAKFDKVEIIVSNVILSLTSLAFFMVYFGVSSLIQNDLNNSLRSGEISNAKSKSMLFLLTTLILSFILIMVLYGFQNEWAMFMSNNSIVFETL